MKVKLNILIALLAIAFFSCQVKAQTIDSTTSLHAPKLLLSEVGIQYIKENRKHPLIEQAVNKLKVKAEKAIQSDFDIPIPKDPGGGYTHEKHKSNYANALSTATLFLLEGDTQYLNHSKKILLGYAEMYSQLPLHPKKKNQSPGRLFWQLLNEEVALVHFVQAFDAINQYLTDTERQQIDQKLLRPMVSFIKDESSETFNKIHNHAMWGVAGVGMAGYVLDEPEWVEQSLLGSDKSGKTGYLKQIDELFSTDGYYSEGPYYHRYALMPLVIFAQAIDKNDPSKSILSYRDGVIFKAIETLVELTDCEGKFFPLNDAIKSKTLETPELGYGLGLLLRKKNLSDTWINVMQANGNLQLTDALVNLPKKSDKAFERKTMLIKDGPQGEKGGIAIFRSKNNCEGLSSLFKFGTHGMGHGHFDELNFLVYHNGTEIFTDYGAARYLNVPQKEGGRYLPENKSWAKHTIAHNTLVVDETTQHNGKVKAADLSFPSLAYFQNENNIKACAAFDTTIYDGVTVQRIVALLDVENIGEIILDVTKAISSENHQYDLPYYFSGQLINSSGTKQMNTTNLSPLGSKNGYEHLWNLGRTEEQKNSSITFLKGQSFYSINTVSDQPFSTSWVEIGANDPHDNLRNEKGFIYRSNSNTQTWVSIIESHGLYNTIIEKTDQPYSQIKSVQLISETENTLSVLVKSSSNSEYKIDVNISKTSVNQNISIQKNRKND